MYRSEDGAGSWQDFSEGLTNRRVTGELLVDPADPSTLYVGTAGNGVYKRKG